jgi:hypothetical protein
MRRRGDAGRRGTKAMTRPAAGRRRGGPRRAAGDRLSHLPRPATATASHAIGRAAPRHNAPCVVTRRPWCASPAARPFLQFLQSRPRVREVSHVRRAASAAPPFCHFCQFLIPSMRKMFAADHRAHRPRREPAFRGHGVDKKAKSPDRRPGLPHKPLDMLVPAGGLEPPLPLGKRILSPLRLPVPPSGHAPTLGPRSGHLQQGRMARCPAVDLLVGRAQEPREVRAAEYAMPSTPPER